MSENLNFPIPNTVLEPYIKQAVSAAIVGALGDGADLVAKAVQMAINTKVASDGKVSNYSSDNRFILAEVVARNKIIAITKEVINEMAEQLRPQIESEVRKELQRSTKDIAKTIVNGVVAAASSRFSINVNFKGD